MNLKEMSHTEIKNELKKIGYFAKDEVVLAIRNAAILEKPILVEGPPGVGKTELAKAISMLNHHSMIRLQCSPEINERKALYDFNYSKQLLFIQMLKDQVVQGKETTDMAHLVQTIDQDNPFYSEIFLIKRPILEAFSPKDGKPKVLLIDELDKAEEEFEFSLLEPFSDFTVSIPEIGTIQAQHKPMTIVTSNRKRKISDTFARRCVYVYIDYPTVKEETEIILAKTKANPQLAEQVAGIVSKLRNRQLTQPPSIAESVEWATVLSIHCGEQEATKEELLAHISVIAKNQGDQRKVRELLVV